MQKTDSNIFVHPVRGEKSSFNTKSLLKESKINDAKTDTKIRLYDKQKKVLSVLFCLFSVLLLLALLSYSSLDNTNLKISFSELLGISADNANANPQVDAIHNWLGPIGAIISNALYNNTFGYISILLPFVLLMWAKNLFNKPAITEALIRRTIFYLALGTMLAAFAGSLQKFGWFSLMPREWSGSVGLFLSSISNNFIGKLGTILLFSTAILILLMIGTSIEIENIFNKIKDSHIFTLKKLNSIWISIRTKLNNRQKKSYFKKLKNSDENKISGNINEDLNRKLNNDDYEFNRQKNENEELARIIKSNLNINLTPDTLPPIQRGKVNILINKDDKGISNDSTSPYRKYTLENIKLNTKPRLNTHVAEDKKINEIFNEKLNSELSNVNIRETDKFKRIVTFRDAKPIETMNEPAIPVVEPERDERSQKATDYHSQGTHFQPAYGSITELISDDSEKDLVMKKRHFPDYNFTKPINEIHESDKKFIIENPSIRLEKPIINIKKPEININDTFPEETEENDYSFPDINDEESNTDNSEMRLNDDEIDNVNENATGFSEADNKNEKFIEDGILEDLEEEENEQFLSKPIDIKPLVVSINKIIKETVQPKPPLGTAIHDEEIDYKIPPVSLLVEQKEFSTVNEEELEANAKILQEKLETFKISIENLSVTPGPVVTLYEFTPAAGIKISKIESLADDLAMALKAKGIRIIAPVPGRGTVGIEIPNQNPTIVRFSSVINSPKFQETTQKLPLAFGKTISGEVFIADLDKMPHLLIAGATGSGKSVGINTVIASLLYKQHPSKLKFIFIDPKKVELQQYSRLGKHYLAVSPDLDDKIISNPKDAVIVLKAVVAEMEQRYEILSTAGQRNILEYNKKVRDGYYSDDTEVSHRPLPYIVVIIDELADLMLTASKEIEEPIARLAQMARAVGIHLIVATQRPSVDVITGIIKANFPARIAYMVRQKVDSRTILDVMGAEQLLGNGDMLFLTGGTQQPIRVQNALLTTDEVEAICDYIYNQKGYSQPYILPSLNEKNGGRGEDGDSGERDEFFEDAARLVIRHQQGSVSLIQRRLKVGYARAGRIIDELENAGVVGPYDGSKSRQVYMESEMELEAIL